MLKEFIFISLPDEISKIQHKEVNLQDEIEMAIESLHGIRVILYAPFGAFEGIVRKQILQLEPPIAKCVGLVIDELSKAVRNCTKRVRALFLSCFCSTFLEFYA